MRIDRHFVLGALLTFTLAGYGSGAGNQKRMN